MININLINEKSVYANRVREAIEMMFDGITPEFGENFANLASNELVEIIGHSMYLSFVEFYQHYCPEEDMILIIKNSWGARKAKAWEFGEFIWSCEERDKSTVISVKGGEILVTVTTSDDITMDC